MTSLILSLGVFAQAGGISGGGGGNSVVCFKDDQIVSAKFLDLYEGEAFGLTYETETEDFDKELERLAHKLYPNEEHIPDGFLMTTKSIRNNFKRIPEGARLEEIPDSLQVYVPKNCKIIQTVNYYTDSLIWIDGEIFDKLPFVHQLALIIHEALYRGERARNVTDSRYIRRIVALLMSQNNPFNKPVKIEGNKTYLCTFEAKEKKTRAYMVALDEKLTEWKVMFFELNGHKVFAMKSFQFSTTEDLFAAGRNVLSLYIMVNSTIDPNELIGLRMENNRIEMSWQGSHPGDSFSFTPASCTEH